VTLPGVALVFDCDGVLADTERFGHLPAFNQTFEEAGLPVRWSEEEYARKVLIGGGKERMASLLTDDFVRDAGLPTDPVEQARTVAAWHKRKTAIFKELVRGGKLPGRPGVARVVGEALGAGWTVAVASTSAEESVRAVLEHVVGPDLAAKVAVYAGDIVPAKKPDPAIYELVVRELDLDPARTLVVEDSRNGLVAATGARLRCLVTVNPFTEHEDFSEAVLVVSSLGDPDGEPTSVLANRGQAWPGGYLTLADLEACLAT
jgi:HAD superfamily hydrolase (TIGR01509 family)